MKLLPGGRFAVAAPIRLGCTLLIVAGVLFGGSQATQDAVANGDTRTISVYHTHTKETVTVTFRRNGQYDERGLEQLNWILRDWRRDQATRMDARLFDIVWAVHREVGSSEPIHIVSAYRSPETNSMLRRRSSGVAENSQHLRGKAIDFFLPDVAIERVRAVGMRLQYGGVGYYPTSYNPFVHLDVGSVRAWPRMTRDQLVRLFPDGKTVHLPTDGRPLPGYEEARAEVLARGGTVAGVTAYASADPAPGRAGQGRSFWARVFGGEDDEDVQEMRSARNAGRAPQRVQLASAAPGQDESPSSALLAYNAVREPQRRPAPASAVPDPLARTRSPEIAAAPASAPATAPVRTAALAVDTRGAAQALLPPVPPRRPDEVVATGTLAFAPLPPPRPDFAAAPPPVPAAAAPEKPAPEAPTLVAVPHPLPPARPAQSIQVAAVGPISLPGPSPVAAVPTLAKEQREEVRALFGRALTAQAAPAREARTAVARVRVEKAVPAGALASGPALALAFSKAAPELATDRFAGPAVKPLPVLR